MLETLNLKRKDGISQYLKYDTTVKDNTLLLKIIGLIRETIIPCTQNKGSVLVTIATGKVTSPETEQFLLNFQEYGAQKRLKFLAECMEKPERFEEKIERQKRHSFATELGKKTVQTFDWKVLAACFVRDLFVSLLCLSPLT